MGSEGVSPEGNDCVTELIISILVTEVDWGTRHTPSRALLLPVDRLGFVSRPSILVLLCDELERPQPIWSLIPSIAHSQSPID